MTRIRGPMVVALLVVMAAAAALPAAVSGQERDYFRVGVITSLSGELMYGGHVTRRGYDMWAETVNAQGGIEINGKRYPVELIYADAQSNPAVGADAVERLITEEGIDFLLGPYSSAVTLAVAPITDKYRMPHITGSAESPLIWQQKFRYTFGTVPNASLIAPAPLYTIINDLEPKPQTIAVIGMSDAFSQASAEMFRKTAEELGLRVVRFDTVPEGSDVTPVVTAARAQRADILAVGGHASFHIEVVRAAQALNYNPMAIVMHYGVTSPDFVRELGDAAEYVWGASVWTEDSYFTGDPLFGDTTNYVKAFTERWGTPPDYTEAGSTVAGIVFQEALKKIGATPPLTDADREALVEALEEIDLMTLYGRVRFASEGEHYHNNIGLTPIAVQIQNGQSVVTGPGDLKLGDPWYPTPAWRDR